MKYIIEIDCSHKAFAADESKEPAEDYALGKTLEYMLQDLAERCGEADRNLIKTERAAILAANGDKVGFARME